MAGRLSQALLPRWRVMVLAMAVAFSQATTGADADSATAVPVDYSYSALSVPVLVALLALICWRQMNSAAVPLQDTAPTGGGTGAKLG